MSEETLLPRDFVWRRIQSLAGLWLVLFIIEHLLTNSQAALWIGDDGRGFIDGANWIHSLPYITAVEVLLLGVPILAHIIWGLQRLWSAKLNSFPTDGSKPDLSQYSRNHAYSWQRITSYLLIIGIALHVYNMRFLHFPETAEVGSQQEFMVRVSEDPGIYTLAERLNVRLYNQKEIAAERSKLVPIPSNVPEDNPQARLEHQHISQLHNWVNALEAKPVSNGEVIAVSKDFGTAELMMVRNNFKSWTMIALYSLFVVVAAFHAFNGLWTFLITWGIILSATAQRAMLKVSTFLMIVVGFFGLSAVWLTYWINLRS